MVRSVSGKRSLATISSTVDSLGAVFPVCKQNALHSFLFVSDCNLPWSECEWMEKNVPKEYIVHPVSFCTEKGNGIQYWTLSKRLPALGHLHLLYSNGNCCLKLIQRMQPAVAMVDLPSAQLGSRTFMTPAVGDLCICDCVLPPDSIPPFQTVDTDCLPVLTFLLHTAQVAYRWVLFSTSEVGHRLRSQGPM